MAVGNLALPVGHVPVTAASAPKLTFCLGRPFRQPVDLPDSADFSPGLEIRLSNDYSNKALFSMFDGELSFVPAANAQQLHTLQLDINARTQKRYNEIAGLLEPVPYRLIYENVDKDLVQNALSELIQGAYAATSNSAWEVWHPIMRIPWNGMQLKVSLDLASSQGGNALTTEVNNLIAAVLQPVGPILAAVPVLAGDLIGAAAPAPANEPPPAGCEFGTSRVTIMIEEYAENKLNPIYYIWRLLKNAYDPTANKRKVQVITRAPLQGDHTFDHPLLKAMNIRLDKIVRPRAETNALMPGQAIPTRVLLFPTGSLSQWHGVQWATDLSMIEWRITNDANLDFEARLRDLPGADVCAKTQPAELRGVDVCPQPQASDANKARVQRVWNDWGDAINETCLELQFPAELVVVTIAHESNNDPRALALESLKAVHIKKLQGAKVPQAIIDAYVKLAPAYSLSVPNPWSGSTPIKAAKSSLTWDELLTIIDVVPERMSPGLMQTLIQLAIERYSWLQSWYPDVPSTFGVIDPFAAGKPKPRNWFFWLLTGPNSILVGTADHKYDFARQGSRMDLPRMASIYNAGQRKVEGQLEPNDAAQLSDPGLPCGPNDISCPSGGPAVPCDSNLGPCRPNPWRMRYYNLRYPRDVTRFYNAINDVFGAGENGRSRFWRTLA